MLAPRTCHASALTTARRARYVSEASSERSTQAVGKELWDNYSERIASVVIGTLSSS